MKREQDKKNLHLKVSFATRSVPFCLFLFWGWAIPDGAGAYSMLCAQRWFLAGNHIVCRRSHLGQPLARQTLCWLYYLPGPPVSG